MRKIALALVAAGSTLVGVSAAQAEGGCGPGFHRGYYGACRPNFGPGPVVGGFYAGRGYWWGGRYWGARRWYGRGWRYY